MKTRIQVLEDDHDSALSQLIENEINLTVLTRKSLVIKPGAEYDKLNATIMQKKHNISVVSEVLQIIEEMLKKEKKKLEIVEI